MQMEALGSSFRETKLDGDPGAPIPAPIFVASKASWFEITDALPQYAGQQTS